MTTRARIHGRVQGVWYRAWTVQQATERGLTGWVRNRSDGTVEAIFCGPKEQVDGMIVACHDGPELAKVENIETEPAENKNWDGFTEEITE